ncbi:MAG: hypothetical protein K1X89_06955 [Myxococcaceae bacterium]|nr:hypothetical protein [Myxococcaceae bacterium]
MTNALLLGLLAVGAVDAGTVRGPVVLKPGQTLGVLCRQEYGNEHYAELIALINGAESSAKVKAGQRLALPLLGELVAAEGFTGQAKVAAQNTAEAAQGLLEVQAPLKAFIAGHDPKGMQPPPAELAATLRALQGKALAAAKALDEVAPDAGTPPKAAVFKLHRVADGLLQLARGQVVSPDYDQFILEQDLALALTELVKWRRKGQH